MKTVIKRKLSGIELLIIGVYQNETELPAELTMFANHFQIAVKNKQFEGKTGTDLLLFGDDSVKQLLVIGLGEKKASNEEVYRVFGGIAGKKAKALDIKRPTFFIPSSFASDAEFAKEATIGLILGSYEFVELKSDKQDFNFTEIGFFGLEKSVENTVNEACIIAEAVNDTRDLCTLPGNLLSPTIFANKAKTMAESVGLSCMVLSEEDMRKENMNALLSVSQGSDEEAKLIVLEHTPQEYDETIVFVGKGLTFDAGGISIKPSANMHEMKTDMSGGAAVYGALKAVAELNLPIHVVGIIPSSENLLNGKALKPGDVITSKSGKTVEVLNTDAEGRLILCDSLTYAERFDPDAVIDIATLTGAVIIGLGHHVTALLGNNEALIDELHEAGELCSDRVWELPLYDEYKAQLKSDVADVANIGGRPAGSITAAAFLSHFSENYHWAHLDIAGTSTSDGKKSYQPKGSTGVGVRLFIQFLQNRLK